MFPNRQELAFFFPHSPLALSLPVCTNHHCGTGRDHYSPSHQDRLPDRDGKSQLDGSGNLQHQGQS